MTSRVCMSVFIPSIPVAEDLIYRETECLEDLLTAVIYLNGPADHANAVFSLTLTVYSEQIQAWVWKAVTW